MDKEVAVLDIIIGALAFTYTPGIEIKTVTSPKETTITQATMITETPGATQRTPSTGLKLQYNEQLANRGVRLFKDLAYNAYHTVKSVGIEVGGNIGLDLSKALLGNVGVEKGTAGRPISLKYFQKNGLADLSTDYQKAAQLLAKFLTEGDKDLASTMPT